MASTTTNIGLTKPAGTDQALISAINGNMDIIDTKMGAVGNTSVQGQITALSDQIEWKLVGNVTGSTEITFSNYNDYKEYLIYVYYGGYQASQIILPTDMTLTNRLLHFILQSANKIWGWVNLSTTKCSIDAFTNNGSDIASSVTLKLYRR